MKVKCSKCRYKFDVWVDGSQSSVDCVCPRCGTPFAASVPPGYSDAKFRDEDTDAEYRRTKEVVSQILNEETNLGPEVSVATNELVDGSRRFCPYCGHSVKSNTAFCEFCGRALDGSMGKDSKSHKSHKHSSHSTHSHSSRSTRRGVGYNQSYAAKRGGLSVSTVLLVVLAMIVFCAILIMFGWVYMKAQGYTHDAADEGLIENPVPVKQEMVEIPKADSQVVAVEKAEVVDESELHPDESNHAFLHEEWLTAEQLNGYSRKELKFMRNEFYAYYGYSFNDEEMMNHFTQFDWYKPTTHDLNAVSAKFTDTERHNISVIQQLENSMPISEE